MYQAHLKSNTYELIVSHLEKELDLNDLETPDELQINTVTQQASKPKHERPKPSCHHCKNQITTETSAVILTEERPSPKQQK